MSNNKPTEEIREASSMYIQGSGGDSQSIHIMRVDEGCGPFWRIETEEWSFDSLSEFVELLRAFGEREGLLLSESGQAEKVIGLLRDLGEGEGLE